jgi:hypothetical protein
MESYQVMPLEAQVLEGARQFFRLVVEIRDEDDDAAPLEPFGRFV